MRDLVLVGCLGAALLLTLRYPFVGLLSWAWFSLMTPHQMAYGAFGLQLNMLIAAATFAGIVLTGAFRHARLDLMTGLTLAFGFWLCLSQLFSLSPTTSAPFFDRFIKVLIFVVLCIQLTTDRLKLHALVWMFVLGIGYFALKGGLFTIATLGAYRVQGLPNSILEDNNHLGTAIATMLPFALYLHGVATKPIVRAGLVAIFVMGIIAVLGTHSRGAFIALLVFGAFFWVRARRKFLMLAGLLAVMIPGIAFMPAKWTERMTTISEATQDSSFMGRVDAWVINTRLAIANPLTGAGLRNPYNKEIAATVDRELAERAKAAHSIYFEVLGGSGFGGLALFLTLIAAAFLTTNRLQRLKGVSGVDPVLPGFGYHAQIALAVFCVGGAAVSMEMWDGFWIIVALVAAADRLSRIPVASRTGQAVEQTRRWRFALRGGAPATRAANGGAGAQRS